MAETEMNEQEAPSVYEASFHIDANLSETEVRKTFDAVKSEIAAAGGTPFAEALPVRINLAYTISQMQEGGRRDHNTANFAWVAYELASEKQADVEEALKGNTNIIRHLVVTTTKEEATYAQDRAAEKLAVAKQEAQGEEFSDDELEEVLEETTA